MRAIRDFTEASMGEKVWYTQEEIVAGPMAEGATEPYHIHFHFVPPRPADLCVTLDPVSREPNAMAGTVGPLTWTPYTICLHIARNESSDSYRNLIENRECVIAFPTKQQVRETWILNMGLPRGINELEVARLTPLPSKWVAPPGIAECPVNLECKVEFWKDYYTHGIFFCKVLGGSIDEEMLSWPRERMMNLYPTYEVDDVSNRWKGRVERLGVLGELYDTPIFPMGVKEGWWPGGIEVWISQLEEEGYLSREEARRMSDWQIAFESEFENVSSLKRVEARKKLTRACELIAWEEWEEVRRLFREG
jgi:flavin reductase (DIM6/NTAB) family NADH-FMN oxidoreductase RutF